MKPTCRTETAISVDFFERRAQSRSVALGQTWFATVKPWKKHSRGSSTKWLQRRASKARRRHAKTMMMETIRIDL